MKFGLPETTVEKINGVFARYPEIEEVIIYGSRAKGNFREYLLPWFLKMTISKLHFLSEVIV